MALPSNFKPENGPSNSRYTISNLRSGEKVKLRVLSEFITGKSVWGDKDGKRVCTRRRSGESIPASAIGINRFSGNPETVKQFIAAIVWNYGTKQVEILETDKSSIIGKLFEIESDSDWGDVRTFDLTISKKGEGMDTEYSVLPLSKSPFECSEKWKHIRLEALFTSDDPFASEPSVVTTPEVNNISEEVPF